MNKFSTYFVVLLAASVAHARDVLNPATYVSPSGEFVFSVDPSRGNGAGGSSCRLLKNGASVWEERQIFTFAEAVVSDLGYVAGYGYSSGSDGMWKDKERFGEFIVALMGPDAKVIRQHSQQRVSSRFPHQRPNPQADGIVLDQYSGRFIVRVRDSDINRALEEWRVFDLKTGELTATLKPGEFMQQPERPWILDARAVPGTPLVLTHWRIYANGRRCGIFTLVGLDGKPVWTHFLDADYDVPGNDNAENRIDDFLREKRAILDVTAAPAFTILSVREMVRVAFALKNAGGNWEISETARTHFAFDAPPAPPEKLAEVKLNDAGVVRLDAVLDTQNNALTGLACFEFDAKGNFCGVRRREKSAQFIQITPTGKVLKELELPRADGDGLENLKLTHTGASRFVAAASSHEIGAAARFFSVDFDTDTLQRLDVADVPAVEALAGLADGRFAALTQRRSKYTSTHGLYFFNAGGRQAWKIEEQGYRGKPVDLLSPCDISRYGNEALAVLDHIKNTIQIFDAGGKLLRVVDLEKSWRREPNYPTHIAADGADGFVIYDFDAPKTLVRCDAKGRITSEALTKFMDGRVAEISQFGVKCAPDGGLWSYDGDALLGFNDAGLVERAIGRQIDKQTLYDVDKVFVSANECVFITDRKTHFVHVFSADGKKTTVLAPDAPELAWAKRELYSAPGGSRWSKEYGEVLLMKNEETVRTVSRRADRHWFETVETIAVAVDGGLAVLSSPRRRGEVVVSTFTRAGEPVATFAVPQSCLSGELTFNGRVVCVRDGKDVRMYHADGKPVGAFRLDYGDSYWHGPFSARKGKQIWFLDVKDLILHRFEVGE